MEYQSRYSPLHRSLNEIPMIGGVEKRLAVMNGTLTLALVFGTKFLPSGVIGILAHYIFRYVTRNEPRIVPIYLRWTKQADIYDPWVHINQIRNPRPAGIGRGNLC